MMGKLGFDIDISHLSATDLQFCREAVKTYDSFKDIVWHGDQYRLSDPFTNEVASVMYVDKAKSSAVVFSYLVNNRYGSGSTLPVRFKGLDASKKYKMEEINLYPGTKSTLKPNQVFTGDFLMQIGFNPDVNVQRTSVILKVEEVN